MRTCLLGLVATVLVACGGADVPSGGDGGSGVGGSSAAAIFNSASAGTPSGGGADGTGGAGPIETPTDECEPFCAKADEAGCTLHPSLSCAEYCEASLDQVDHCDVALATYYRCEAGRIATDGCGSSSACEDLRTDYIACVFPPDGTGEVTCETDPEGHKLCTSTSSAHVFASDCYVDGEKYQCSCDVDGEGQGTCVGPISDEIGCCLTFFARTP